MTNKERDELITYPLIKLNEMLDDYPESESPERTAIAMGIRALEKEKEQALQEAKTSSNKNVSITNDNTKLKECQEVIDVFATKLIEYYRDQLSKEEQKAWELYKKVLDTKNLLEEANK